LIVVCEGNLDDHCQGLVSRLSEQSVPRDTFANLTVRTLDPRLSALKGLPGAGKIPTSVSLAAVVLRYPEAAANDDVVWSGPCSEATLKQLLDSPMRRRIVQRLVRGDCAVWVLLESGDPEQDNAAARVLQTRIEHCQRTLTLPTQALDGGSNPADLIVTNELKVAFSMLRLARNDLSEEILVRLLLGLEDDLNETKEPMAFPIYGRGRVLYALVGKGINPETIDEACSFLTGPCSCIIKEQNPGFDLLLSADWDHLIRPTLTSGLEGFALTGLAGSPASSRPGDQNAAAWRSARAPSKATAARLLPQAEFDATLVLKPALRTMGGLGTLVLVIGCWILLRKRD